MYSLLLAFFLSSFLLAIPTVTHAATPPCTLIYGGGEMKCEDVPTATPTQTVIQQVPNQTKGGLPVNPPSKATTTPATGPETLALMSLIPMAAAGIYLRKKSR